MNFKRINRRIQKLEAAFAEAVPVACQVEEVLRPWRETGEFSRRKTRPTRGDRDPAGTAPSAVPVLRRADDHRSRTAAQTSARPTAPADLHSPGPVSSLPQDIYGAARLVAAVRALPSPLPATSLGAAAPSGWQLGAIRTASPSKAAMPSSSNACCRRRAPDLPGDPFAGLRQRTKPISPHRATDGPRSGMGQSFPGSRIDAPPGGHHPAQLCRWRVNEPKRKEDLPAPARLVLRQDTPRQEHYPPRPLTVDQDRLIQPELRRRDDRNRNAFRLLRHTGMRIGECPDSSWDHLRRIGQDSWALHVPLGKLKTEGLVPVDAFVCRLVDRLRLPRSQAPLPADGFLLAAQVLA